MGSVLKPDFYVRENVVQISRELLGCYLFTLIEGEVTGGRIIETEAYGGADDRACHAYQNRRTARTEVMFHQGGISYVYLCYGMHHLLNVVTNKAGIPHAILIRAIEPIAGLETMFKRRKRPIADPNWTRGPGKVTQALGIDQRLNGMPFSSQSLWIEEGEAPKKIRSTPRIGVEYAKEHAKLPWRFITS